MSEKKVSQFHDKELEVQKRLGVADKVAQYSEGFIRKVMPQQHRDFFCELPFIIMGLVDTDGAAWAIPLFAKTGFITSPTASRLHFAKIPELKDLLKLDFVNGSKIGLLGIQLDSRRRNRMNGVISDINKDSFSIDVEQSFGNCPQYIQTRKLVFKNDISTNQNFSSMTIKDQFTPELKSFIESADTFYIASRTKIFNEDTRSGIDVSHRGGKPGFIKVDKNKIYFPDFSGNQFFNTLGNIESDGRVGLLFADFTTGNVLLITGSAKILWDDPAKQEILGAQRIIEITVQTIIKIPKWMPMTGELQQYSPTLNSTGIWDENLNKNTNNQRPLHQ